MYPKGDSYFGSFVKDQMIALQRSGIEIIKVVKTSENRISYLLFFLRSIYYLLSKDYELVHAHYGFHSALPSLIFKRAPLVVTYHRGDALEEPLRNPIYHWLQCLTVKRADYIIAVSQEIKDVLVSKLGADESKISVISCGVDTDVFKPYKETEGKGLKVQGFKGSRRKELGLPEDKPIILFPGLLSYRKGIDIVYQCASLLPDVIFVLMGAPNPEPRIPNPDNCILVGPRPHSEIPRWLNAADIFFLPSRSEGTPVSLLEALACGVPAITSAVGGIPDVIRNGKNGWMIELDNIDLIVSKITELIESREKREFMGKKARESIKRFDQRKITDRIKKVYLLTTKSRN